MTRRFLSPGRLAAFTLIELLTVITIILVLAGLLLHIAGNAQYKSSMARATSEIQAISTALESYKADNGVYPRDTGTTDMLNAQTPANTITGSSVDPKSGTAYRNSSRYLYQSLAGLIVNGTVVNVTSSTTQAQLGKSYFPFKTNQLYLAVGSSDTNSDTPATSPINQNNYLVDPFGYSYGYSTAAAAAADAAQTNGQPVDTTKGYNPTFDLWSTGGFTPSAGKTYASKSITVPQTVWAKNW